MKSIVTALLILVVFLSALEIVITQHQTRKLFVEIQELEKTRDGLNEEWGRLQLEQSTWATDDRIENMARMKLGMEDPQFKLIILVMQ